MMTLRELINHRSNPLNSLFVKIFLWFWLTALVLMLGVALSTRQVLDWMEPIPANPKQVAQLEKVAQKLVEHQGHRRDRPGPRFARRYRVIIWDQGDTVVAPPAIRRRFLEIADAISGEEYTQQKYFDGILFVGPKAVELAGQKKLLFLYRKVERKKPQWSADQGAFRLQALLYILGSGFASFLLAWTITRRLHQLREATGQLRRGDFDVRLPKPSLFIDEIDRLFIDFNGMAEHIKELIASQQSLLQMTSHEIRSPLTRIGVALGIAQQGGETDACLARIEKEIDYLDRLLAEILKLAAVNNEIGQSQSEPLALLPIVQRVIDNARFVWQEKRDILLLDNIGMTDASPKLSVEENLFYLALENLVNNALKYSPEAKPVRVKVEQFDSEIALTVCDEGEGVDPEFLKKMFEPFTRKNYSSDGFGLGLAITRRIIRRLGGRIDVNSGAEGGLEVALILPKIKD